MIDNECLRSVDRIRRGWRACHMVRIVPDPLEHSSIRYRNETVRVTHHWADVQLNVQRFIHDRCVQRLSLFEKWEIRRSRWYRNWTLEVRQQLQKVYSNKHGKLHVKTWNLARRKQNEHHKTYTQRKRETGNMTPIAITKSELRISYQTLSKILLQFRSKDTSIWHQIRSHCDFTKRESPFNVAPYPDIMTAAVK